MSNSIKDAYKTSIDWLLRNATAVIGLVGALMLIGFSKFVLSTIAIGVAISFISITLTQIVLYCLTKLRFIDVLNICESDSDIVRAAKIMHNGIIRFVPVLIYGAIMIGFAISILLRNGE
jgi:hypothetical protein